MRNGCCAALLLCVCMLLAGCGAQTAEKTALGYVAHLQTQQSCTDAPLPRIDSEEKLLLLLKEAVQQTAPGAAYVTEQHALSLPDGGAQLAHALGVQAVFPLVRKSGGQYLVECAILYYEGERVARAAERGETASLSEEEKRLLCAAQTLLKDVDGGLNDYDTAVALHDLVCAAGSYVRADLSDNRISRRTCASGVLLDGQANCQGYSDALQLLCLLRGIPCRKITGEVDGGPHVWNLICIDGKWMHVDATYDDSFFPAGESCYLFFGPSAELLSRTHSWDADTEMENQPGEMFFYARKGLMLQGAEMPAEQLPSFLYRLCAENGDSGGRVFPGYESRVFGEYLVFGRER